MPRPRKWRRICCLPQIDTFGPLNCAGQGSVVMTIDEYETIRLIDYEGLKQEQCALRMEVARTTVQGIYEVARKKLADALINGKTLTIEGGDYLLCDGRGRHCGNPNCGRRMHGKNFNINDKEI